MRYCRGAGPQRCLGSYFVPWTAGIGQDIARLHYLAGDGGEHQGYLGTGGGAPGRSGGAADESRGRRYSVYRRDSPLESRGGRGSLPSHGRLPDRYPDWSRSRSQVHEAAVEAIYVDRSNDPVRTSYLTTARSLWAKFSARFLFDRSAGANSSTLRLHFVC